MKPRGQWILGIDFGNGDAEPKMLAIPMRRGSPLYHQAEVVSKEGFEAIIEDVRRKVRNSLHKDDGGRVGANGECLICTAEAGERCRK